MFREVSISGGVPGRLFLHSMPGRRENLESAWHEIAAQRISTIVCLAGTDEIRHKSPDYGEALARGAAPCPVIMFEIRDFGVPKDRDAYWALAGNLANRLVTGDSILIHCGAGGAARARWPCASCWLSGTRQMQRAALCRRPDLELRRPGSGD